MARYNCLLIDLDDTLLDFSAAEHSALEKLYAAHNIPLTEENFEVFRTVNDGLWAQFEKGQLNKAKMAVRRFVLLAEKLSLQGDPAKLNEEYLGYLSGCGNILPGADEFLEESAEVATIAAVSNGIYRSLTSRIAASGLENFFDAVFISEKMGCQKPQRRFFDTALKNLGISNREKVLVIGDSLTTDIAGGIAAELDTCWFNYKEEANNTEWKPTHTVFGYEQLMPIIYGKDGAPDVERKDRHRDGR